MSAKIVFTKEFLSIQKATKKRSRIGYEPQKVKTKRNSKNGVKTVQRPLF